MSKNIEVKSREKTGLVGIYRFTKAALEKPEHFALNDKITEKRDAIASLSKIISESREPKGLFRYFKNIQNNKHLRELLLKQKELRLEMGILINQLHRICKTEIVEYKNLIPTVGRTMIANNLTDPTPTNDMVVNKAELGSSTTAPTNGDTALITPVYRNDIASLTNAANVAYITAFFNAVETSGTYREAGIYSDGTGSLGDGILVSRVAINVTKTVLETLTIDWQLTIN